jgi:Fe-S-cluster containining protein
MAKYDCLKCPGFCCSYPVISITKADVERLARHHGLAFETARERFTKEAHGKKYALRRKADEHFGRICRFFDTDKRRCTIYEARPEVCRSYPTQDRCGYYDFLSFERKQQGDETWVARTDSGEWR